MSRLPPDDGGITGRVLVACGLAPPLAVLAMIAAILWALS